MMKQLLYVEKDEVLVSGIQKAFGNGRTQITIAGSIEQAAGLLSVTIFDLILLDATLDDTNDGVELVYGLREQQIFTPVCFITQASSEAVTRQMRGQNCIRVLPKTMDIAQIINELHEMLFLTTEAMPRFEEIEDKLRSTQKVLGDHLLKMS